MLKSIFSKNLKLTKPAANAGLFGITKLAAPQDMLNYAATSLTRATQLATEITELKTPSKLAIHKLDELSNTICKSVDLASFLRCVHPNNSMVEAAQQTHEYLFEFMNTLNTNSDIYNLVKQTLNDPNNSLQLNYEERQTVRVLYNDFIKSGMHLETNPNTQKKFIELTNQISLNGQNFIYQNSMSGNDISVKMAEHMLVSSPNPDLRRNALNQLEQIQPLQLTLLRSVLKDRTELAQLAGFENYADYELSDKMWNSSFKVNEFLTAAAGVIKPLALEESKAFGIENVWDYHYKLNQLQPVKHLFDASKVFDAIAVLAKRLYNLDLRLMDTSNELLWSGDIKKLGCFNNNNELVGYIYLDLTSRPNKQGGPAHYTIQCSRMISNQLPIVALVCNLNVVNNEASLYFEDVETIFHEMGHALHSMLGRTQLQNVSGTRCSTDFVELPSIFFEKFASHPTILKMISPSLNITEFQSARDHSSMKYWETWYQIQLSGIDQEFHGQQFAKNKNQELENIDLNKYRLFPNENMHKYAKFNHLISYGATYYSYLLDRSLASLVYSRFKNEQNWSLEGNKFVNEVLKYGGSKDPLVLISSYLNHEPTSQELADALNARAHT